MIRLATVPAWYARKLSMSINRAEPADWVVWCETFDNGVWRRLRDIDEINDHVFDWLELNAWCERMIDYNLGFLATLKLNKIRGDGDGVMPQQLDPLFHAVMAAGYATLDQLKTTYSLEDVFLMLDSITTTRANEKIAADRAREEASKR